jgi:hypothetical protein
MTLSINAPSVSSLVVLLGEKRWPRQLLESVGDALETRVRALDWGMLDDPATELEALATLQRLYDDSVVDKSVITKIFGEKTFRHPLDRASLGVLNGFLRRTNWAVDRQETGDLRQSLMKWLSNFLPNGDLTRDPFSKVLRENILVWNALSPELLAGLTPELRKTFAWLVKAHMDSICLQRVQYYELQENERGQEVKKLIKINGPSEALASTRRLAELDLHWDLLHVLRSTLNDCMAQGISSAEAFNTLTLGEAGVSQQPPQPPPPLPLLQATATALPRAPAKYRFLQVALLSDLVGPIFTEVLKASEDRKKADADAPGRRDRDAEAPPPPPPPAPSAVIKIGPLYRETEMWGRFALWHRCVVDAGLVGVTEAEGEEQGLSRPWRQLSTIFKRVTPVFTRIAEDISAGLAATDLVSSSLAAHDSLTGVWMAIDSPLQSRPVMLEAMTRINSLLFSLQTAKEVASSFFPDSQAANNLIIVESLWKEACTVEIANFLRVETGLPSPPATFRARLPAKVIPLPQPFVDALPWLQLLKSSPLFQYIWDEHGHLADDMTRLVTASQAFHALKASLVDGTATFERLSEVVPILLGNKTDLSLMSRTAPGFSDGEGGRPTWTILPLDVAWVGATQVRIVWR